MAFTVSYRQSGVVRSDVKGLVRHEFRDVDKLNGIETKHKNEMIVPERTSLNESFLFRDGEKIPLRSTDDIIDELDRRLEKVETSCYDPRSGKFNKSKLRSNTCVVRDIVMQLDPLYTGSSESLTSGTDKAHKALNEVKRLQEVMIDHCKKVYGEHNILAYSLHLDETSPHIHMLVTPIDDKGRVRQASFIDTRNDLKKVHKDLRSDLLEAGYDAEMNNRGLSRSHMNVEDYKEYRKREEDVYAREESLEDREKRISKREEEIRKREAEALATADRARDLFLEREQLLEDQRKATKLAKEQAVEHGQLVTQMLGRVQDLITLDDQLSHVQPASELDTYIATAIKVSSPSLYENCVHSYKREVKLRKQRRANLFEIKGMAEDSRSDSKLQLPDFS